MRRRFCLICEQRFPSFTDRADTFAPAAELRGDADHVSADFRARAHVSAREDTRYNIVGGRYIVAVARRRPRASSGARLLDLRPGLLHHLAPFLDLRRQMLTEA